jgi:hypothetical protein
MRFAILLLLFVIVAVPSFAQDAKQKSNKTRPDFSGLWKLDYGKSFSLTGMPSTKAKEAESVKEGTAKEGQASQSAAQNDFSYSTLLIQHRDAELKVIEKSEYNARFKEEATYFTDGRGESNSEPDGKIVESKSKWDGKQLVTTVFRSSENGKKSNTIIARITWELSKDGKTLTTTWKPVDPKGGPESMARLEYIVFRTKSVYRRAQD